MSSESDNQLDTTELLAQLKDIHLPEAPVPADIWPILVSLAVCTIALLVFAAKHIKAQQTWHKTALESIKNIEKQPSVQSGDSLQQTAVLLKRIALTTAGRESAQHLTGDAWLSYLDNFFATDFFTRGNGKVFGTALYQANVSADDTVLTDLKKLIKRHKRHHS